MVITYALPLAVAVALDPKTCPWQQWDDGSFSAIFVAVPGVGNWLGVWLFIGLSIHHVNSTLTPKPYPYEL